MKQYTIKLSLDSPALSGSGEGFGAVIDADVPFDDVGIPFIPAKRIKGCLLDAAKEVREMFALAGIDFSLKVEETFGVPGARESAPVYFSNLTIPDYQENRAWLEYFIHSNKYPAILSKERVLETFSEIRQQTAINPDGVAFDHSLRTSRLIKKGALFTGNVQMEDDREDIVVTLRLACLNFSHMGTTRNRGFGEVSCTLFHGDREIPIPEELEEICID